MDSGIYADEFLAERAALEGEICRQQETITALSQQQEELQNRITQAELAQSALGGQREQLEESLRRELAAQLEDCPLEEAPSRIAQALSQTEETLSQMAEQEQRLLEKLSRKQELDQRIPQEEQNLRELAQSLSALQEHLAAGSSRKEEMLRQVSQLQAQLLCPDAQSAQKRAEALQAQISALNQARTDAQEALHSAQAELTAADALIQQMNTLLSTSPAIDAEAQQRMSQQLSQQRREAEEAQKILHTRITTNQSALQSMAAKAADLERQEERLRWVQALSNTANGSLAGKEKISLETYIQTTFFDRILRRANLRLMVMSGGQYELKRRREAENNRSQSGLELDVIDHYNGSERSVKSLSGGESFKASLSLALGLSDEVQSAAGGIRLDTMFVDEGFGSLDEESLQQAIRALSALTEGNRLVGIISHVAELKEKIDKQIVVKKDRVQGSHVEILV